MIVVRNCPFNSKLISILIKFFCTAGDIRTVQLQNVYDTFLGNLCRRVKMYILHNGVRPHVVKKTEKNNDLN